jgi:hypothetical protein
METPPGLPLHWGWLSKQNANAIDPVGDPVPGGWAWTVAVKLKAWLAITDPARPEIVTRVGALAAKAGTAVTTVQTKAKVPPMQTAENRDRLLFLAFAML